MKGKGLIRLGIGNVLFITFAAMLGIMAVLAACKLVKGRNIPVVSPIGNWIDDTWKQAA